MSKPFPEFTYSPLTSNRSIRLLHVFQLRETKTNASLPICIQLVEVSLDDDPGYVALSYAWEGQQRDRTLLVAASNGTATYQLQITKNCEDALRRFRKDLKVESILRIWIDVICINQQDGAERNQQASMMADIYSTASQVRVWLGPGTPKSDLVFRSARAWSRKLDFANQISRSKVAFALPLIERVWRTWAKNVYRFGAIVEGLEDDINPRSFWERIWTLQEVGLAKECRIYCGDSKPITIIALTWPWVDDRQLDPLSSNINMFAHIIFAGDYNAQHVPAGLLMAETKLASEPRDKIFALRSLVPDIFGSVTVDYAKGVEVIYAEATRLFLQHINSLHLLRNAWYGQTFLGGPSWAVDWFNSRAFAEVMESVKYLKNEGMVTDDAASFSFSEDGQELLVRGQFLDVVKHCHPALPNLLPERGTAGLPASLKKIDEILSTSNRAGEIVNFLRIFRQWAQIAYTSYTELFDSNLAAARALGEYFNHDFSTGANDGTAAWIELILSGDPYDGDIRAEEFRAMAGRCGLSFSWDSSGGKKYVTEPNDTESEHFDDFVETLANMPVRGKTLFGVVGHLVLNFADQRLFVTESGWVGIARHETQPGDRLVLLQGLDEAFVVRSAGGTNRIIGLARMVEMAGDTQRLKDEDRFEPLVIS